MASNSLTPIQQLDAFITSARQQGIAQQVDEGLEHDGDSIVLDGRKLKNFGSCGYMSLEFDPRVKQGGIDAIRNYGVELSTSRVFLSNPLYPMLDGLLERIFRRPVLMAPTTTLAHLAAMPTLVGPEDVVLLDHQVHSSVQMTAKVLVANGVRVEVVSHSHLQRIEKKILSYKDSKRHIWYMGDGVYSMYGDCAPMAGLRQLLDTFEQFHLYLDDAHGMSWMGSHGRGYVLEQLPEHERLVLVTSLAKGFGTGGGVITCPTREMIQLIRNCGGPQLFSGPLQPPVLGAAVASAKIHLQDDFGSLQKELNDKIKFCAAALQSQPLPHLSAADSPIRFLGVGSTETAQKIVKRLIEKGYWMNIAQFPAVGPHHAGLRFMINRKTEYQDIVAFTEAIKATVHEIIGSHEETIAQIWKAFSKDYRYSLIPG